MNNEAVEKQIQYETRIRMVEHLMDDIDERIGKLELKLDNYFLWIIGLIFVSIIVPVVLHVLKLV